MANRTDSRISEHATKAAEAFVSAYYAASDSPQRTQLVPTLYLPNSSIVWNGTPVSGQAELLAMLNSMPGSKHEVQTFDCHALSGSIQGSTATPPSLLLTVSGLVSHHTPESRSAQPPSNAPKSSSAAGGSSASAKKGGFDPDAPISSHPRCFSQSFLLVPSQAVLAAQGAAAGQTIDGGVSASSTSGKDGTGVTIADKYFVQADTFRFVG
ncbi:uncharacterized protein PFL1_05153 [Pseudozyma flocculosa PF-1]|uniref:Related to MTR2 - mRNA export protein n=2 Tax=Pseudozyma flocculosa TaxID=84751 RepID=A0A5C3F6F4_9BASI|nr:uncharacterized protein PFL1_05153 [Pseudozyma flocculosa PF-1]EPQ27230.1 hypothetical protein PFL1_05153 [Pseudozyma flocculosa PF-1]SPO39596.1 related to MTR2 - mRNA export protein [Pseudozyma flocculosa]